MKIRLTKHATVGTILQPKGWEGEVDRALGESIIRNGRAVEIGGKPAKKTARKKVTRKKISPPEEA